MRVFAWLMVASLLAIAPRPVAAQDARAAAAIERLERERSKQPTSALVLRALGIAYYRAGRAADARTVLAKAHELAPRDGVTALYLGMSAEGTGDLPAARAAYASYLVHGRTRRVRRQLEARLATLTRQELIESSRRSLDREAQLSATPGEPTTIAVLPLEFHGTDSMLAPLSRGLTDLMVTDLSRAKSLTVVERARVQTLLDEIDRSRTGQVDSTTALRAGRIIQAGRLVQGAITEMPDQTLRLDAAIVDVPTARAIGGAGGSDRLEELLGLEKQIVLDVLDAIGVRLSPEERAQIEQRPTRSLAAFLAYGSGLIADDAGRFDEARRHYDAAMRLDPGFGMANQRLQQVRAIPAGSQATPAAIESQLTGTAEGSIVASAAEGQIPSRTDPAAAGVLAETVRGLNPSTADLTGASEGTQPSSRDAASQSTGTENPSPTSKITIIIRQP